MKTFLGVGKGGGNTCVLRRTGNWGSGSVAGHLCSILKALGSIHGIAEKEGNERKTVEKEEWKSVNQISSTEMDLFVCVCGGVDFLSRC